jgi:hypothetical protein
MTKSSASRLLRKKSEKLRLKAKRELLREYPKLMESPDERKKAFDLIDNANVAVDSNGNVKVMYDKNKDLNSLS